MNKKIIEKQKEFLKKWGKKQSFYLDSFELLNKPRRLFFGLTLLANKIAIEENLPEKDFKKVIKLIDFMEDEFYKSLDSGKIKI